MLARLILYTIHGPGSLETRTRHQGARAAVRAARLRAGRCRDPRAGRGGGRGRRGVRPGIRGPVPPGCPDRPAGGGRAEVYAVLADARRARALRVVSVRVAVWVCGRAVPRRGAAAAAGARHSPEHPGAGILAGARAGTGRAVPVPQRGPRAGRDSDDLHGAGVEPSAVLLQLPQESARFVAGRVQDGGVVPGPAVSRARAPGGGPGARLERDAVDGGRVVLPHGQRGVPPG